MKNILKTGLLSGCLRRVADVNGVGGGNTYEIGGQYRNLAYAYNTRGFIQSRADSTAMQCETYTYDNLDRLSSYTVNGTQTLAFGYSPNGNITYNLMNRPASLSGGGYSVSLDYNADGVRRHTSVSHYNSPVRDKTCLSKFFETEETPTANRRIDYIHAEGRVVAARVYENGNGHLYYVLADHLGSWERVLDGSRNTVQKTHFDPWGNRMDFNAWGTPQTQTSFLFDRGFTGHEHYDFLHVINANARLYDPVIGRFFSPDPFVQAPDFSQNYNRYSYCMNNPVMYSDPDGEFFWAPVIIGAMVGAYVGAVKAGWQGGSAGDCMLGMVKGGFVGGLGALLGGVGGAGMNYAQNLLLGTAEGAFTGGLDAMLWGEDVGKGIMYGAISGAFFTTITSENLINALKGYGFKTNKNVFEDFKAGKYTDEGGCWQQDAIDYFFGKGNGIYSSKYGNDAWYNSNTGINYSDGAFTSYDDLLCSHYKETMEQVRYQTDTWEKPTNPTGIYEVDVWQAEYKGHLDLYKNQGLYPNVTTDLSQPILNCIERMNFLNQYEKIFSVPSFNPKWWHFFYKIPRRY